MDEMRFNPAIECSRAGVKRAKQIFIGSVAVVTPQSQYNKMQNNNIEKAIGYISYT